MTADIRLTQYARAGGGAGKIPWESLPSDGPATAPGGPAIVVC